MLTVRPHRECFGKVGLDRTSFDSVDAHIAEQMHRLKIPGASLAIVEGNTVVHARLLLRQILAFYHQEFNVLRLSLEWLCPSTEAEV